MNDDSKKIKLTLVQWRGVRRISQFELAKKTGITERTLGKYENSVDNLRKASYENIEKISKALDIDVDDLFLDSNSVKPKCAS